MTTITDTIVTWGNRAPDRVALTMGSETISYHMLKNRILQIASAARSHGLQGGEVALLFMPQGIEAILCYFGLMHAKVIPSFMPLPSVKQDHVRYWDSHIKLFKLVQPAAVIGPKAYIGEIQASGLDAQTRLLLSADEILSKATGISLLPSAKAAKDDDIALLQHSSGTTALKKGVALSHRAIQNQVAAYAQALKVNERDIVVSWLPMYHDMGLIACTVMPLMLGQQIVMLDPFKWVSAPHTLFEEITRHKGTLTWLPNFAFELLAKTVKPDTIQLDLSSMRAFINCSEPCKAASFERFSTRFFNIGVRPEMLQVCYAMAESVFAITQTTPGAFPTCISADSRVLSEDARVAAPSVPDRTVRLLSTGQPISGIQVSIVGPGGNALSDNMVGEIELEGDFMFDGYYKRPDLTAAKFQAGRYRTGDVGFFHNGELFVLGRNDDLIIVHGRNYFAHEIEAIANETPGLKPGRNVAIAVFNDIIGSLEVVLIAECESMANPVAQSLKRDVKRRILESMGLELRDVSLVEAGWLVKTTSGKISQSANRDKYLQEKQPNRVKPTEKNYG